MPFLPIKSEKNPTPTDRIDPKIKATAITIANGVKKPVPILEIKQVLSI